LAQIQQLVKLLQLHHDAKERHDHPRKPSTNGTTRFDPPPSTRNGNTHGPDVR
jgi:hypothetical protein